MTLLKVENIEKQFKTVKAVDAISFEVQKGQILGLLGPNGAGKSTTISMISTLLKPDQGSIHFKGEDIVKSPKKIQDYLGYIPQEIALYPMLSGMENLRFWGKAYGLKGDVLKEAIADVSDMIGIKDRLKDKVKTYSGGMKRRLNIGVALLHEPELVIMDEPTVGIDPQSRNHILDTVLRLNRDKDMTVIYTSHYMEEVEYLCDQVCIMDQGKIIASGDKEELIKKHHKTTDIQLSVIEPANEAKTVLETVDLVKGVTINDDESLLIQGETSPHLYKAVIDALTKEGLTLVSLDLKKPNLETVFLNLTGKALRD